jgi:hypothetical protein
MLRQNYIIFTLIWMVAGCRTDVDLIAPEARERIVVYAILKAHDSVQYVRLGRLFVTRGDAAAYAARTDLNVATRVKIIDLRDTSRQWLGVPETVLKVPDQPFYPVQVVYRLAFRPEAGRVYRLIADVPDRPDLRVEAQCRVPPAPYIAKPETLLPQAGNQYTYPTWDLTKKYNVEFYSQFNTTLPPQTPAYELRVLFRYAQVRAAGDTLYKTLQIGPRRLFHQGTNPYQRYQVAEKEILLTAYANLQEPAQAYLYDSTALSQAWQLELTALDTILYNYLRINDPATTDFTTVKPEYTNVQNGLGIFGATNSSRRYFRIDACSQYLLRLNNAPPPSFTCTLE